MEDQGNNFMFAMNEEHLRLDSFKNWPFKSKCKCTPKKMAEAGFYHCPTDPEPDLVRCFMCLKELDGWEPSDDPWKEHKSHSKECPFLHMGPREKMSTVDFLKMEMNRQIWAIKRAHEKQARDFLAYSQEARQEVETLADD